MSESEFPKEAEKTIYQRDKTAKEPGKAAEDKSRPKPKPKVKPRKVFVPKKLKRESNEPLEYRVRHIRVSTLDAADMFRQTLIDFQRELAEQPVDDPDKVYHDREKVENLFIRLAKKYSACSTKILGGDLDWVYEGMKIPEELITQELLDVILKTGKFRIPEPIRTRLGYHIIMVCEDRPHVPKAKTTETSQPQAPPPGTGIPT